MLLNDVKSSRHLPSTVDPDRMVVGDQQAPWKFAKTLGSELANDNSDNCGSFGSHYFISFTELVDSSLSLSAGLLVNNSHNRLGSNTVCLLVRRRCTRPRSICFAMSQVLARRALRRSTNVTLLMVVIDLCENMPSAQPAELFSTPAGHLVASTITDNFELTLRALFSARVSPPLLELLFSYHRLDEGGRFFLSLSAGPLSTMILQVA